MFRTAQDLNSWDIEGKVDYIDGARLVPVARDDGARLVPVARLVQHHFHHDLFFGIYRSQYFFLNYPNVSDFHPSMKQGGLERSEQITVKFLPGCTCELSLHRPVKAAETPG